MVPGKISCCLHTQTHTLTGTQKGDSFSSVATMHGPSVQQLDKQRHRKSKKRRRAPPKSHNQHTSAVPPPVGTLYSFSAPLLHGEDSEEFRLSGGSSILPPLTSALTNTPSHDPRTPKDTLAQLYQRVGITPFETPPNQRLTRLYYESAGLCRFTIIVS